MICCLMLLKHLMTTKHKAGFVAIVGRPNVGKSTLLNALIGVKAAITSPKPQTTRHRISGVITKPDYQLVFVDTPGMHKGKDLLNKTIDKIAVSSLKDVDAILFVVDRKKTAAESHIIQYFEKLMIPIYLVINKVDLLPSKAHIDELIVSYLGSYDFAGYFPVSAKDHVHLEHLTQALINIIPEGPQYFPADMKSDQSDNMMMSELVREKILYLTEQEVPHAVAVQIESLKDNPKQKTLDVSAIIVVERSSQKSILIGKNGEKIKAIGHSARKDINHYLNRKVHLTLWIKVKKDWRNRPQDLKAFGFGD